MSETQFRNPGALITPAALAATLNDPNLRVFDCTTHLVFQPEGDKPYRVESGGEAHVQGHIPGAGYLDLQADFSRDDSPYGMTLAAPETVARAFARAGISDNSRVVLYSRTSPSWATRFWWMLRWIGFDNAAILDGGYDRWTGEGFPVSLDNHPYREGKLSVSLRPEIFVSRQDVIDALGDPATTLVNALGPDVFSGETARYGRPGRIPGSVSLPKVSLLDKSTQRFLPAAEIAALFKAAGVDRAERHIAYCGGGIFATADAFMLHQLGHDNVAVYDNSMSEWGPDESLPIETG